MNLTLPILKHTDETEKLEEMGLEINLDDYDTEQVTFYKIYAISKAGNMCSIHTNGTEYLCTQSYEEVWQKLKNYENSI